MSKTVLVLFAACVGLSLLSLHLVKQMRTGQATIGQAAVGDGLGERDEDGMVRLGAGGGAVQLRAPVVQQAEPLVG